MTDKVFAVVTDGFVSRVCELPEGLDPVEIYGAGTYIEAPAAVQTGWRYDDGVFTPSPPAPPHMPSTQYDFLSFLSLFTPVEQAAIVSSDNVQIKLFCLMATGASFVDLTDPHVVNGTNALENLGLIAKGRAAQVLSGQAAVVA